MESPRQRASPRLRAAVLEALGVSITRTSLPYSRATSAVRSVQPLHTTTISSSLGRDSRHQRVEATTENVLLVVRRDDDGDRHARTHSVMRRGRPASDARRHVRRTRRLRRTVRAAHAGNRGPEPRRPAAMAPNAVPQSRDKARGVASDEGQYPPMGGMVPWRGRRQEQHAYSPPPISRHACGDRYHACDRKSDGSCRRFGAAGRGAPDAVSSVEVTATDGSSVTIAWPASRDTDVVGYGVYLNGARVGTQTPRPGEALA